MKKKIAIKTLKELAKTLLMTDINQSSYSAIIVKHPFSDTGLSAILDGKGGVGMIDLTEDDAQFKRR